MVHFTAGCCWFPLRPSNSRPVVAVFYFVARSFPDFALLVIAPPHSRSLFCLKDILLPGLRPSHFAFLGRTGSSSCCFFFLEVIAHRRHLPISVLYARAHTTHVLIHTQEDFDAAVIADDEQWCLRLVSRVSCSFLSLYLWLVFLLLLHSLPFGCVDGALSLIKLFRFWCNGLLSS
jgi:hypothetical protein